MPVPDQMQGTRTNDLPCTLLLSQCTFSHSRFKKEKIWKTLEWILSDLSPILFQNIVMLEFILLSNRSSNSCQFLIPEILLVGDP